ncbi:hypothetical protein [Georhizobium sp. MAB10]
MTVIPFTINGEDKNGGIAGFPRLDYLQRRDHRRAYNQMTNI